MVTRRQASCFLRGVPGIELLRERWNPVQSRLIAAHATLCREDEVNEWDSLRMKLRSLSPYELTLGFGAPIRDDNFVYLPVHKGLDEFHQLRRRILSDDAREHEPHVTIVHPRNGACSDSMFSEIVRHIQPFEYTFRDVMLIEQIDGGLWQSFARVDTLQGTVADGNVDTLSFAPKYPVVREFE